MVSKNGKAWGGTGGIAEWIAFLLLAQWPQVPRGFDSWCSKIFSKKNYMLPRFIDSALLRESGQWKSLIVDRTHLVLVSGKLVLQKSGNTVLDWYELVFLYCGNIVCITTNGSFKAAGNCSMFCCCTVISQQTRGTCKAYGCSENILASLSHLFHRASWTINADKDLKSRVKVMYVHHSMNFFNDYLIIQSRFKETWVDWVSDYKRVKGEQSLNRKRNRNVKNIKSTVVRE